ncbi:hypothetical protein THOD04_210081 [Vibrio owensii]|nr:hypothetical protein THOD04_210081 [Vibrio owensii]
MTGRVSDHQFRPGAPSTYRSKNDLLHREQKIGKAPWQSGYAADCKSVDLGSTPGGASIRYSEYHRISLSNVRLG